MNIIIEAERFHSFTCMTTLTRFAYSSRIKESQLQAQAIKLSN